MRFRNTLTICALAVSLAGLEAVQAQRPVQRPGERGDRRERGERADRYERDQLTAVNRATERLINELEYLQEEIAHDLRGRDARRLYQQADSILSGAMHFQHTLEQNQSREHLYRDFKSFDGQLHQLFQSLEGSSSRVVQRAVVRVQSADDQLHRAISAGDRSDTRRREVIDRQAYALDREAHELAELSDRALSWRNNEPLQKAIHDFASIAHHFHDTVEKSNDPQHLRQDFAELQKSWQRVVQLVNSSEQSAYLYRQARQVGESYNELASRLSGGRNRDRHEHDHEHRQEPPALQFRFRIGD